MHWEFVLIYKEILKGSGAKSDMGKGFLIYEELREYLVIYDEAVSHISLCYGSLSYFPFFNSVDYRFTEAKFLSPDWRDIGDSDVPGIALSYRPAI
jgi:hypothetical protein